MLKTVSLAHVLVGCCYHENSSERHNHLQQAFAAGDLWCLFYWTGLDPESILGKTQRSVQACMVVEMDLGDLERRLSVQKQEKLQTRPYHQMANFYSCFEEKACSDDRILQRYWAFNGSPAYQASLSQCLEERTDLRKRLATLCLKNPSATNQQKRYCHHHLAYIYGREKQTALSSEHYWQAYLLAKQENIPDLMVYLFNLLVLINDGRYTRDNTTEIIDAALTLEQTTTPNKTDPVHANFYCKLVAICLHRPETHQKLIQALIHWDTPIAYDYLLQLLSAFPNLEISPEIAQSYYDRSTKSDMITIVYAGYLYKRNLEESIRLVESIKDLPNNRQLLSLYHLIKAKGFSLAQDLANTKLHIEQIEKAPGTKSRVDQLNEYGVMLQACGDNEGALNYYKQACEVTPESQGEQEACLYYNLGRMRLILAQSDYLKNKNLADYNACVQEIALPLIKKAADLGDLDALLLSIDFSPATPETDLRTKLEEINTKQWHDGQKGYLAFVRAKICKRLNDDQWINHLVEAMENKCPEVWTLAAFFMPTQEACKNALIMAKELRSPVASFLLEKIEIFNYLPLDIYRMFVVFSAQADRSPQAEQAQAEASAEMEDTKDKKDRSHWQELLELGCEMESGAGSRFKVSYKLPDGKGRIVHTFHKPHGHNLQHGGKKRAATLAKFTERVATVASAATAVSSGNGEA